MALGPALGCTFVGVGAVAGVAAALVARRSVRLSTAGGKAEGTVVGNEELVATGQRGAPRTCHLPVIAYTTPRTIRSGIPVDLVKSASVERCLRSLSTSARSSVERRNRSGVAPTAIPAGTGATLRSVVSACAEPSACLAAAIMIASGSIRGKLLSLDVENKSRSR